MATAEQIITLARETLGTPYQHQGRLAGIGLDCIGVPIYVAQQLGLEYIDQDDYSRHPYQGQLETMVALQPCLKRVYVKAPGDLLLMKFARFPQHVGIFTGDNLIHAYESVGRVVEHYLDADWLRRICYVYRFK